jgi:lipopolysaccharide transport system ATP-binding protein
MNTAIKVENLSKAYQIGQFGTGTISHDLNRWWALKRGKEDPYLKIGEENVRGKKGESNIVWSLKDVNFEIEKGSTVGIIGKNGAGKSTLLKILSQVTSPTNGNIKIRGRISSLLEVGTGFHPELSGRENIFLNGAILGMRKNEIERKFDEIVDFSGVERYIDTPVKRYSSGMYVRLAFGVAAHLESEILIVDEVLAVGDAEFQKKCLGKMGQISTSEGRTILFVSHNMSSINQLCDKSILLENGTTKYFGNTSSVIQKYMSSSSIAKTRIDIIEEDNSKKQIHFTKLWITDKNGIEKRDFFLGEDIRLNFEVNAKKIFRDSIQIAVHIATADGIHVCHITNDDSNFTIPGINNNLSGSILINDIRFYPNVYSLSFWLGNYNGSETYDSAEDFLSFEIVGGGELTNRDLPRNSGLFFLNPEWHLSTE